MSIILDSFIYQEAVQKATSQYKEKPETSLEPVWQGTSLPQSQMVGSLPPMQGYEHPEQMAQQDRLQAQVGCYRRRFNLFYNRRKKKKSTRNVFKRCFETRFMIELLKQ